MGFFYNKTDWVFDKIGLGFFWGGLFVRVGVTLKK
jgi:hypothetical protein